LRTTGKPRTLSKQLKAAKEKSMSLTIDQINSATHAEAIKLLDGIYEHSPWVADQALAARPFKSLSDLKLQLARVLHAASKEAQSAEMKKVHM
jgi:2-oxo-4-hydroxy-4-carboxy--5-ureidoimidazoline (OHCU) decarboxylase